MTPHSRHIRTARRKLEEHGLGAVPVEISTRAKRRAGAAFFRHGKPWKLQLAAWLLDTASEEEILETILHEIAHLLAGPRAGHGPKWKVIARSIGCTAERCHSLDTPPEKWEGRCAHRDCAFSYVYKRHRLIRRTRRGICPKCRRTLSWKDVSAGGDV